MLEGNHSPRCVQANDGFGGSPSAVSVSGAARLKPIFVFALKGGGGMFFAVDHP